MPKLQNSLDTIQTGWCIHVYDRQRRLVCTLEPSHGWTFGLGLVAGIGAAIVWANLATFNPPVSPAPPASPPPNLQVD